MRHFHRFRARAASTFGLPTQSLAVADLPVGEFRERLAASRVRPLVAVDRCTGYRFTRYGRGGESPQQEACETYVRTGSRDAVGAVIRRHVEGFRARSLAETLFESDDPSLHPLTALDALAIFEPWTPRIRTPTAYIAKGLEPSAPISDEVLQRETDRHVRIVESLRRHGYQPMGSSRGYVTGFFLVIDGDWRFRVRNGLHRIAALAALGVREVNVRLDDKGAAVIDAAEVDEWHHVRSGYCPRDLALRLMRRHFH